LPFNSEFAAIYNFCRLRTVRWDTAIPGLHKKNRGNEALPPGSPC
jgi:hypothetical protein